MKNFGISLFLAGLICVSAAGAPSRLIQNLEAGNSQTLVYYGTSLTEAGKWTVQLTEVLQARYGQLVNTENCAKSGRDSVWGLANLASRVIPRNPDTVIIEFSMNDAIHSRNISVENARANLLSMVSALQQANPDVEVILLTMNPVGGEVAERTADHPYYRGNLPDYYQMVRDVAASHGLQLIDLNAVWNDWIADHPGEFGLYVPDGVHPNKTACREVILPGVLKGLGGGTVRLAVDSVENVR
ncbi:SGNH/GDSL hydrolase family protein [Tichowtungia aerotolerans]|uniref:SGNH/GDSL hydrolase family protein n=1 Tax=Tichowtungia aerotolerans TaxID=2697043 RepID=A0A6P1M720_9BACT|nr:GDSL-type esterase/lipase family protein [Tichowtungia aerotolerans]QHI67988.1 SGNH/GDSL hydrolase family protein [Tichowtungia aerotolerans]